MTIISNSNFPTKEKLALGVGFFTAFYLGQSVNVLAIPYYQMTLGVNPVYLSLLMAIPLLLASTLGPLVGHASDKLSSRFGRRRPFLFFAAIVCCLSYGMIWMVPTHWSQVQILLYFGATTFVFNLACVFYTVPLNSLIYDFPLSSPARTTLLGFTTYFVKFGSLSYQWLFPLSQMVWVGGVVLGVRGVGWGLAFLVFGLCGIIPALVLREPAKTSCQPSPKNNFLQAVTFVMKNKNMLFVLALIIIQMGGSAYVASMDYYLLVYFVNGGSIVQGSIAKGLLSTAYALISMLAVPLIVRLANNLGKLKALSCIYILNAMGGFLKWFIFVPGAGWYIVVDAIMCGAIWSAMVIIIPAMIADVVNENSKAVVSTAQQRTATQTTTSGMFSSIYGWVLSVSAVLALLMNGVSLRAIHFNAALGAAQSPATIFWMRLILSGGTVFFSLLSLSFLIKKQLSQPSCLWSCNG
jgi:glycoside/pentoside/hexuronide:cation symporter, GPH family